ncbi:MAG: hypothetical protein NTW84_02690 [Methanothrix sp.]|nr:hypothetical protein [Methanothrix sp.]
MKRDLLDILACPLCKGDLTLEVFEENEKETAYPICFLRTSETSQACSA